MIISKSVTRRLNHQFDEFSKDKLKDLLIKALEDCHEKDLELKTANDRIAVLEHLREVENSTNPESERKLGFTDFKVKN